ncbi:peptidylprolyl isomerase [alpha proteobacterium AAP81b]|nr:peptidylprolyl isomerase [alpha proteobacterium AAP81b]
MRRLILALLLAAGPAIAPVAAAVPAPRKDALVLASGTQVIDDKVGTGVEAFPGKLVVVHYTGWLFENGGKGKQFDSSRTRNEPFDFPLGAGQVIQGWDEGVAGMKVGGKRTLIIPAQAGYGDNGAGADIPPGATLIFEIELIDVR